MENYKLILDEQLLTDYVNSLPDLENNEKYFISLLARKKYNKEGSLSNLTADKNQLKRVTASKGLIIEKIKQMEVKYGSYLNKGVPIQQENLALYITPNPRDCYKASGELMKELTDKIINVEKGINPQSMALSCIQTSCSRMFYYDLDIDIKKGVEISKEEFIEMVKKDFEPILNLNSLIPIQTHGGLHVLVCMDNIEKQYKKSWYQNITKINSETYKITMNGDNLVPLVGCTQGGIMVKHVEF